MFSIREISEGYGFNYRQRLKDNLNVRLQSAIDRADLRSIRWL